MICPRCRRKSKDHIPVWIDRMGIIRDDGPKGRTPEWPFVGWICPTTKEDEEQWEPESPLYYRPDIPVDSPLAKMLELENKWPVKP